MNIFFQYCHFLSWFQDIASVSFWLLLAPRWAPNYKVPPGLVFIIFRFWGSAWPGGGRTRLSSANNFCFSGSVYSSWFGLFLSTIATSLKMLSLQLNGNLDSSHRWMDTGIIACLKAGLCQYIYTAGVPL